MIDAKTLRLVTQNGLQGFAQGCILDGIAALRTLLPYCAAETILCAEAESLEHTDLAARLLDDLQKKQQHEPSEPLPKELLEEAAEGSSLDDGEGDKRSDGGGPRGGHKNPKKNRRNRSKKKNGAEDERK